MKSQVVLLTLLQDLHFTGGKQNGGQITQSLRTTRQPHFHRHSVNAVRCSYTAVVSGEVQAL
ncbi:Uncharacterised protein [Mycobacteroides abscessus subsp. bolletii]|nr:Uncharacterised protein [Mycobacteroides abscessus subsp. bolletii]SLD51302.1 Uncharacterised protein [Mycobacteroides abscessus subsp. bolletii]SLE28821.1 Uncharacterised protein [Mycobacteroides abscessus subsp. bolletii]